MEIIGRKYEQKQLKRLFESNTPEFIAVYGRRRVGKTYLIREFFASKSCVFFQSSGVNDGNLELQLDKFKKEIENTFYKGAQLLPCKNWHEAFESLNKAINIIENKKTVIFLDEVPWMATHKSSLLEALDYYWNRYWSSDKRIKLIICGSAASWIIDNVLHNTGGLHNRVTHRMRLEPFSLPEVKDYLRYKNVHYNNEELTTLYMCLGGVPFYLNLVKSDGISAVQNINSIFFNKKSTLYDEFKLLFASLFKNYEIHEEIITFVASKREGIARNEIESHLKYKGGRLTERLNELEESGFLMQFTPWQKERGIYYKVIDEYTLFYLSWVKDVIENNIPEEDNNYWDIISKTPGWQAWSGLAFEAVCYKHITQIKKALHIPNGTKTSVWRYIPKDKKEKGAQIDLVFDRPDNTINLCEIKYCSTPFILDKKYSEYIINRENIYCEVTKTKKQIFHSMIVSGGLKKTMYSDRIVASYATLDDLFITE